jgi:hypothetical protein
MPSARGSLLFLSDEKLLKLCRVDVSRGSGPGGQKRNKTSNSIRLTHPPSGVSAVAEESRSQQVNKLHALRRLRLKLAMQLREPIAANFEPPDWFLAIRHNGKIEASYRHPHYAAMAALVLDLLAMNGSPAKVGIMLGITTSQVIRILQREPQLWNSANQIRAQLGLNFLIHRD